jgi:hypothetical protein
MSMLVDVWPLQDPLRVPPQGHSAATCSSSGERVRQPKGSWATSPALAVVAAISTLAIFLSLTAARFGNEWLGFEEGAAGEGF